MRLSQEIGCLSIHALTTGKVEQRRSHIVAKIAVMLRNDARGCRVEGLGKPGTRLLTGVADLIQDIERFLPHVSDSV